MQRDSLCISPQHNQRMYTFLATYLLLSNARTPCPIQIIRRSLDRFGILSSDERVGVQAGSSPALSPDILTDGTASADNPEDQLAAEKPIDGRQVR